MPRPDEIPQRRAQFAVREFDATRGNEFANLDKERCTVLLQAIEYAGVQRIGIRQFLGWVEELPALIAQIDSDATVLRAGRAATDPDDFTGRGERVEHVDPETGHPAWQ